MSVWLLVSSAFAHEALFEPIPRYPSDGFVDIKSCPCGSGPNDGMCSNSSARSDPNRDPSRVTTYDSGQTITVRLHEVVGHSGRWRIAFDPDGADLDDFNANILLDVPDPSGAEGNAGQGDLWEFDVTLPNVGCDNCTLQVIQVMNGNTTDPVTDPTGASTYYQCADLTLVGGPEDTGSDTVPVPTTDTTTDPTGTTTPTTDDTAAGLDADEASGCGCTTPGRGPAGAVLALGLALVVRRRR